MTMDRNEGKVTFKRLKVASTAGLEGVNIVQSSGIEASAVTAAKIATSAVTAAKIGALAVTSAKIATSAVTAAKIAASAVETAKVNAKAITATKVADAAIGSSEPGVVVQYDIAMTSESSVLTADITTKHRIQVIDVLFQKIGSATASTASATVKAGTTVGDLTQTVALDTTADAVTRATRIYSARHTVPAGNIIRVTRAALSAAANNSVNTRIIAVKRST